MPDVVKYKYRTVPPRPLSMVTGEQTLPGHSMGYYVRTNTMLPVGKPGRVVYTARCTCKWVDKDQDKERVLVPKRMLEQRFQKHLNALKAQLVLDV